MPSYYKIDIPFKIFETATCEYVNWQVTFKNESALNMTFVTAAKFVSWDPIVVGDDEDFFSFLVPNMKMQFVDPIHLPDSDIISLFVFITGIDYNVNGKTYVEVSRDSVLKYSMIIDAGEVEFASETGLLDLSMVIDTKEFDEKVFRQNDTAMNPLSLLAVGSASYKLVDIIGLMLSFITGRDTIDNGLDELALVFKGLDWTDASATTSIEIEGQFDDLYFRSDVQDYLIGNNTYDSRYGTAKTVSEFLKTILMSFQLRAGVDQYGESFIYERLRVLNPEVLDDGQYGNPSFITYQQKLGVVVTANRNRGLSYLGDVTFDNDGNVVNSDKVNTLDPLITGPGFTDVATNGGDFYLISTYDSPTVDAVFFKAIDEDSNEVIFDGQTNYLSNVDYFFQRKIIGYAQLPLRGTDYRIYKCYQFKFAYTSGYIDCIMVPMKLEIDEINQITRAYGYVLNTKWLPDAPVDQATSLVLVNPESTTNIDGSCTLPSSLFDGIIVLIKTSAYSTSHPVDGTMYEHGDFIGSAKVAYVGNASSFVDTGYSNDTYYVSVYTYKGWGSFVRYNTTSPLQGTVLVDY